MSSSYFASMNAKIDSLKSKRATADRSVKAALEAHNSDPSNDDGYLYYRTEIQKIPERREAALIVAERKRESANASKQNAIEKLEQDIETYTQKKEAELESLKRKNEADIEVYRQKKEAEVESIKQKKDMDIEVYKRKKDAEIKMHKALIEATDVDTEKAKDAIITKYETQVRDYSGSINRIVESLSEPTSQVYQRNKKQVEILSKEIAELTAELYDREEQEHQRKRKTMQYEQQAILAAERQREVEKKQRDLEAWERATAAQRKLEEERTNERQKNPIVEEPKPPKVVLIKFKDQSKTIAQMTAEDATVIDVGSIPEELWEEWVEKFGE